MTTSDLTNRPDPVLRRILVIGYGNELRSDDRLGPDLAGAVQEQHYPGVEVLVRHQLTPELAEPVSNADMVIFIDARLGGDSGLRVEPVLPDSAPELRTHFASPSVLLSLAAELFGRRPRAWSITLPAFELGFGEGLSAQAEAMIPGALRAFKRLSKLA